MQSAGRIERLLRVAQAGRQQGQDRLRRSSGPSGSGSHRRTMSSMLAVPQMPQLAVATVRRSLIRADVQGDAGDGPRSSRPGGRSLPGRPGSRASISLGRARPSVTRNPMARSSSWPGVRMVTATSSGSWPGPAARIWSGSSPASVSMPSVTLAAVDGDDGRGRAAGDVLPRSRSSRPMPGRQACRRRAGIDRSDPASRHAASGMRHTSGPSSSARRRRSPRSSSRVAPTQRVRAPTERSGTAVGDRRPRGMPR